MWIILATTTILVIPFLLLYRLAIVTRPRLSKARYGEQIADHLLIVLGSGGHTAEMIAMLERAVSEDDAKLRLDWRSFKYRTWIVSSGDSISAERAHKFEAFAARLEPRTGDSTTSNGDYIIHTIPRARKIHQPLYTAPFSSLQCLLACVSVLTRSSRKVGGRKQPLDFPDLILCNGPATATIMIFTSVLLRLFDVRGAHARGSMRTVYVESWARVKKLSLSGTLLSHVVDRFLVQWPQLVRPGGKAEYIGVLV